MLKYFKINGEGHCVILFCSWKSPNIETEPAKPVYQTSTSSMIASFSYDDETSDVSKVTWMVGSAPRQDDVYGNSHLKQALFL